METEIWDAYYPDGTLAGTSLIRGEPIESGLRHLAAEILVRHQDGDYLLMERDPKKKHFGGFWEATAGGSALKGEDPLQCARRELEEETGLTGVFREIGRFVSPDTIYVQFLCRTEADKACVTLQPGETTAYRWVSEEEFGVFVRSGEMIPVQKRRYHSWLVSMGYLPETCTGHGTVIE